MFCRILLRTQIRRLVSLSLSPHLHSHPPCSQLPKYPFFTDHHYRCFSTNNDDGNDRNNPAADFWKISQLPTDDLDDIFGPGDDVEKNDPFESEKPKPKSNPAEEGQWVLGETDAGTGTGGDDVWSTEVEGVGGGGGGGGGRSKDAEFQPWSFGEEEKEVWSTEVEAGGGRSEETEFQPWSFGPEEGKVEDLFGIVKDDGSVVAEEDEKSKAEREMIEVAQRSQLEKEKQSLLEVIQGPNRAFGDLIAASGITDEMIESLIALLDFQGVQGLPPLEQIEDARYEKTLEKSSRYEIELQKQADEANARVREVDEKGRAYGTGKRKCSIARVWIQPGEGKFFINDKEFDVYFPMLDHRAALLRPFSETKTVGLWDIRCTVKGGGTTGQVGAIRLGICRALQKWEPGLRAPLREVGFLTRDSRVVERKKPGKAKARKSFQWSKR